MAGAAAGNNEAALPGNYGYLGGVPTGRGSRTSWNFAVKVCTNPVTKPILVVAVTGNGPHPSDTTQTAGFCHCSTGD